MSLPVEWWTPASANAHRLSSNVKEAVLTTRQFLRIDAITYAVMGALRRRSTPKPSPH